MCDLRDWSPEESGVCVEEYRPSSSSSSSSDEPVIKAESLQRAEEVIQGIIAQIQPNYISEDRRRAVTDYVQRLIRGCLGCEVFPFGSVPLKTYLPDGDIDLTAMVGINAEEALANDVFAVLEREDQNPAAEFVVKDVQLIRAEVKLVKCIIQNIVVDISFNQLGGLCTLCFLEQVDRLIKKDHLFKRSIILIKAWCYYESRILGAHHGLISTYALETLVLYIFHLFHSSLNGPLAVLYKFLDYYSKFDWEKYCVSLNGPVVIASLPEIVVEAPEQGDGELLLSNDFLRECMEIFSVPSKGFGINARSFTPKNFNILDPLKESNNLGRSVSKGNFFRIRRAFCYGVQKFQKILSDQTVDIEYELREIFSNTLDRHGSGQRPDVQDPIPTYGYNGFRADTAYSPSDSCQEDHLDHDTEFAASDCITGEQVHHGVTLHGESQNAGISTSEKTKNRFTSEAPRSSAKSIPSLTMSDAEDFADNSSISLNLHGESNDLPASRSSISSNGASRLSPLSSMECPSSTAKADYVPHLHLSQLSAGEIRNGDANQEHIASSGNEMTRILRTHFQDTCSLAEHNHDENQLPSVHDVPSPVGSKSRPSSSSPFSWSSEEAYSGCPSTMRPLSSNAASHEHANSLFDLSGDYESHISSLQYGRWCYEYALGSPAPQISLPYVPQFSGKNPWERSVQHKQNVLSQINANGIIARRAFYPINSPVIPGVTFAIEEATKPRGTGTYFPNANHYRDRHPTGRGMNHGSVRSPRNNARSVTSFESFTERAREYPQTRGKPGPSEIQGSGSPGRKSSHNYSSGSSHSSEKHFEFGSFGHHPTQLPDSRRQAVAVSVSPPASSTNMLMPEIRPKTETGTIQDRTSLQSYHLKDEDDFPPLSESTGRG